MTFGIQVKTFDIRERQWEWKWMHPTGGARYEFATGEEAHRMKEMCYPLCTLDEVRVCEITED